MSVHIEIMHSTDDLNMVRLLDSLNYHTYNMVRFSGQVDKKR